MKKLELFRPLKLAVPTQLFGVNGEFYRRNGIDIIGHNGLDYAVPHGTPVHAAHDGVAFVGKDSREGIGVVIRTHDLRSYEGGAAYMKTIYWHLATPTCHGGTHAVPVRSGQRVKVGDVIGYANNTGFSTNDHLHFGLKPQAWNEEDSVWWNVDQKNGYLGAIDPLPYLSKLAAEDYSNIRRILDSIALQVNRLLGRAA
jgi:murein DD-endopeptidase MepM/ murein hydrolase activator NlpD